MKATITTLKGKGWVQSLALAPDGTLWAVSYRDNLLRSTDLGDTWEAVSSPTTKWLTVVAVTPDGAVLVGDEKGALHESSDLGQSWEHTPLRGGKTPWCALVTGDAVFVGGGNVFRRRLGEAGWSPAKKGPRGFTVRALSRTDDGALFAYCREMNRDRAGWRSLDGGDTWERLLMETGNDILALHASGDRVYALLASNELLSSHDRGATWARHPLPFKATGAGLWSAGRTVYALDVATGRDEDDGEVWRSLDGASTWELMGEFAPGARTLVATAQGDIVAGGSLNDRGATGRWRDPAVAAFMAAHPLAPRAAPAPSPPASKTEASVEALMLDRLLTVWRAKRHPKPAKLIERLGKRCAPKDRPTTQAQWMTLAKRKRPEDLSALLATWRDGTMAEVRLRFDALETFDDDPRLAAALAAFVREFAYGATSSKPLWNAVGARLIALGDRRTTVIVEAAAKGPIAVDGAIMKAWLTKFVRKLAWELEGACGYGTPLDAGELALCEEAERLLK